MTTIFSTLKHSDDVGLGADGQHQTGQNRQIYYEIFSNKNIDLSVSVSDSSPDTDVDFDLSDILKRAVNTVREKTHLRQNPNVQLNSKYPCSICYKNVNRNQKAIFCSICQKWVHKKCNGTSVREYEYQKFIKKFLINFQLSAVLSALGISFVLLGITETKQQIGKEFISNVNIDNYLLYTEPSRSPAGGVAIYINNKLIM